MAVRFYKDDESGADILECTEKGIALLKNSLTNRGSSFTREEREEYGLLGILPAEVGTIETQLIRAYSEFQQITSTLGKHVFLRALQDRNEVLFYRLLQEHITEMMPIMYTPTVGQACQQFSRIYRQPRGLFISYDDREKIDQILENAPLQNIEVIVVTDGERILGLGDQGVGGMGIPVGKLSIYTLCGGIHPSTTLPIFLDVGTNNQEKLSDPLYLGARHERIQGKAYDDFIEAFINAVKKRWPSVLLQWEDFARHNARSLLERYRNRICSFNDDIQGTAAVALAGLFAACKAVGEKITDQRIALLGAGTAGVGIAEMLLKTMVMEGLSEEKALENFYLVDKEGLLHEDSEDIQDFQRKFALSRARLEALKKSPVDKIYLEETVELARPTVLIGTSAQRGAFTETIVRKMAETVERPIIFPLSNPISRCEANPADLVLWTGGKAIIATGSPATTLKHEGKDIVVSQCNNSYIFPGFGLGVIASKAKFITDEMFAAAAECLSQASPILADPSASLFPPLEEIKETCRQIALAVGLQAQISGAAEKISPEELQHRISKKMWTPAYPQLKTIA